jgi:hypothetical protein
MSSRVTVKQSVKVDWNVSTMVVRTENDSSTVLDQPSSLIRRSVTESGDSEEPGFFWKLTNAVSEAGDTSGLDLRFHQAKDLDRPETLSRGD